MTNDFVSPHATRIIAMGDSILNPDGSHEVRRYGADGAVIEHTIDGKSIMPPPPRHDFSFLVGLGIGGILGMISATWAFTYWLL